MLVAGSVAVTPPPPALHGLLSRLIAVDVMRGAGEVDSLTPPD